MANDLTLAEIAAWADQHQAQITFHVQGGVTLQTPDYATQVAYSIQAAIQGCESRIAEAQEQYGRDETAALARAETPAEPYTDEGHYL